LLLITPLSRIGFCLRKSAKLANSQRQARQLKFKPNLFSPFFTSEPSRGRSSIAAVLWAEIGEDAILEFVRRLVFSVLIGNADMHLKNWSLLIPNDKLGLSFGDSHSLSEITPDQMRRFADKARIPASPLWKIAVETAQKTAAGWKSLEQADLLPKDLRASIQKQILRVAATVK
jgi:serine/threonine-protein kinase HipA